MLELKLSYFQTTLSISWECIKKRNPIARIGCQFSGHAAQSEIVPQIIVL